MEFGEEIFQENYDKCFNLMNQIIEFRNQYCLFRLPKAMNPEEAVKLCLIGIELDKILNK